jgi:hypothetical protein
MAMLSTNVMIALMATMYLALYGCVGVDAQNVVEDTFANIKNTGSKHSTPSHYHY